MLIYNFCNLCFLSLNSLEPFRERKARSIFCYLPISDRIKFFVYFPICVHLSSPV
ncbi:unnamed protein product [Arabidopsis halleri]